MTVSSLLKRRRLNALAAKRVVEKVAAHRKPESV
jgi:hypothetical protein